MLTPRVIGHVGTGPDSLPSSKIQRNRTRMEKSRIAGQPVSWGINYLPGWGVQLSAATVLDEMRQLGIVATEYQPGLFPPDAASARELLSKYGVRRAMKTEIFYPCPAIIIGNGDTPAVQLTERHFRSGLRKAHRRFQTILKYLPDHISHPLTAGVVEQCLSPVGRIGNDHDIPAFPSQVVDSSKLIPIV